MENFGKAMAVPAKKPKFDTNGFTCSEPSIAQI